jgi:hypothetical protein
MNPHPDLSPPQKNTNTSNVERRNVTLVIAATFALLAPQPSAAQEKTSSVTIEVIGGPHAGKHTLLNVPNGCNYSERRKPPSFGSNLGRDSKDPKALTSMQMNIRNLTATTTSDPADFEVSLTFGPVMDSRLGTFYISGSNTTSGRKGGPGTVTFKDVGKDAQVTFEIKPQPDVTVKGTVTCALLRY